MTIKLGQKVRDVITGFEGIATARVEYLNGCIQYCVKQQKLAKDGAVRDGVYFDHAQLKVVGDGVSVLAKDTGGPMGDTPRSEYRG
jgi:hypothetical protein